MLSIFVMYLGKIIKSNTAQPWAGTTIGGTTGGFATAIPFAAGSTRMNMRVYSPDAGIPVRVKVEDPNDPTKSVETEQLTTVSNAWETLEFNFANQATGTAAINYTYTYKKLTVFFNFGTSGATAGAKTYYFDDVAFGAAPATQVSLPVTFDATNVNYDLVDFEGNTSSIVTDLVVSSNKVCKIIKSNTAQPWAGTTIGGTTGGFATAIPFAAGSTKMNMRVYSPDAGIPVRVKVEDPNDPTKSVETEQLTTVANAWETLEFNFANQATGTAAINYTYTYKKLTVFFNFGTSGATAGVKTYYFDDVAFGAAPATQVSLPVTFDATNVNYDLVDFGGNASSIVTDPAVSSNKVCKVIKSNVAELWAGTTIGGTTGGFATAIPFAAGSTKMNLRVYSPDAGIPVRVKVEDPNDPTKSVETEKVTTVANAWETLEINFANQATGTAAINYTYTYKKLSVFFNFGTTGAVTGAKTYYFDDVLFGATAPALVDLPVTFDNTDVNYDLVDFGGNASSIVTDLVVSTNKVCKVIKSNTAELWAGTTIGGATGFATAIPFVAGSTKMTMRVYSADAGIPVRMKVEDPNDPTKSVETEKVTTVANAWETLEFNFANQAAGTAAINFGYTYKKLSVFFNFGTTGSVAGTKTYYFDDVAFDPSGTTNTIVTFEVENPASTPVYVFGNWNNWGNWPGDLMTSLGNGLYSFDMPLTSGTTYEFLFVSGSTPVKEVLNPAWSCTNGNAQYTNRVLVVGSSSSTICYKWALCDPCGGSSTTQVDLPVTFDNSNVNYDLVDFGGNVSEILVDPTDPANKVVKTIRTAGAEIWAGTSVGGTLGFVNPIPFTATATSMSVKVWSPVAGIPVILKAEDATNSAINVETEISTTVAMAWETLVFDFSNEVSGTPALSLANTYNKTSIFFNFGVSGAQAGEQIYYWDDVEFYGGVPSPAVELPVTFEDLGLDYALTDFGGNSSQLVADPANPSNRVAKTIKTAGAELWAGTTVGGAVGFANPVPFVAGYTSMSVRVWSPAAGTPVRLKVEAAGDPTISVETEAATTLAAAWETLVFNFSNQAAGTASINFANSYNKASIFFNFGSTGAQAGEQTYYWDDMEFYEGTPPPALDLPVTFEDGTLNYGLTDFGGNSSQLVADPANPANKVAKTIKTAASELWAGTTVGGTVGFANPIPFVAGATSMSVRVWSPTAGTPIRLKVEAANDPTISVETEARTTVANAWEFLHFNFSNQAPGTAALNFAYSYNKASIFFNFGSTGAQAGEKTYYWDDIYFGITVGTEDLNAAKSNVVVFPNPASNYFNLGVNEALDKNARLIISDINGKILSQENIQNSVSKIGTSELKSGIYLLRILNGNKQYNQRLMIAK
jgi:hypothetical protein